MSIEGGADRHPAFTYGLAHVDLDDHLLCMLGRHVLVPGQQRDRQQEGEVAADTDQRRQKRVVEQHVPGNKENKSGQSALTDTLI